MPRKNMRKLRETQQVNQELDDAVGTVLEALRTTGKVNMYAASPSLILNLKMYYGIELGEREAQAYVLRYMKEGPMYNPECRVATTKRRVRERKTE